MSCCLLGEIAEFHTEVGRSDLSTTTLNPKRLEFRAAKQTAPFRAWCLSFKFDMTRKSHRSFSVLE